MPRLRRSDSSKPGLTRRRRGSGFEYLDAAGRHVSDAATLERIRALVIPPAWQDVWICADANGHLQAVGTDQAGRRQYLYHEAWRARRDQEKFDRMLGFARSLPRLRRIAEADLAEQGLTRGRVLACAVRLLDVGFFRIGGEEYAAENGSYGLATIERRHVTVGRDGVLVFDYPAKSGQQRSQAIVDREVHAVVSALQRRRGGGEGLLAYQEQPRGRWIDVRSEEINAYIKAAIGSDISAKDFRTWHATVLAAVALAVSDRVTTKTGRERAIRRAVEEVAHYLGNTPAVCRASYIDPRVFDRFRAGQTIAPVVHRLALRDDDPLPTTGPVERAVIKLLAKR